MSKTNRKKTLSQKEMFSKMIKDMDPIEIVLLVERIERIMDSTVEDIRKNPKNWDKSFISPNLYINLKEKISKHFNYGKV